jgi:hypothetical protein
MKKSFYPDDIMEFKLNNKWFKGSLKDIKKSEKKYILSLDNSQTQDLEHKDHILVVNNFSIETLLKSSKQNFNENERVEFYDTDNNCWSPANIESMNKDFYIVSYADKTSLNNTKIIYKNNLRPLTNDIISLELRNANSYSLQNFKKFTNPLKFAKKFISKLLIVLNEKILYTFLNDNFELFLFMNESQKENDPNNSQNEIIINGLIEVAIKHFEEIEKMNKNIFK